MTKRTATRGPNHRVAGLTLLVALAACGPATPPSTTAQPEAGDGAQDWSSALSGLAASGTAVYSFRFDGAPPRGAFYTLALHDADATTACNRYGANPSSADSDFWLIEASVNDSSPGDHAISLSPRDGAPLATANVTLLHRKQGAFVEAYDAVSGTVSLASAPAPQDTQQGATLDGRIEADFPSHAVQEISCQGGVAPDGGSMFSSCTCRDSNGVTSTCTPGPDGQSCCHDLTSARIHVTIPFSASPCSAMCRWAAGLSTDYCYQYFGG